MIVQRFSVSGRRTYSRWETRHNLWASGRWTPWTPHCEHLFTYFSIGRLVHGPGLTQARTRVQGMSHRDPHYKLCLHTCTGPAALGPACQVPTHTLSMGPDLPTACKVVEWPSIVSMHNLGSICQLRTLIFLHHTGGHVKHCRSRMSLQEMC